MVLNKTLHCLLKKFGLFNTNRARRLSWLNYCCSSCSNYLTQQDRDSLSAYYDIVEKLKLRKAVYTVQQ